MTAIGLEFLRGVIIKNNNDFICTFKPSNEQLKSMQLMKNRIYAYVLNQINAIEDKKWQTSSMINFISELSNIYYDVCFHHDLETKDAFRELGLSDEELSWLIPANEILARIDEINKKGKYLIFIPAVFFTLNSYFYFKFYFSIIEKYKLKSQKSKVRMDTERLRSVLRTTEKNKQNNNGEINTFFDALWAEVDAQIRPFLSSEFNNISLEKFMIHATTRNFDSYIISIYKEYTLELGAKKHESEKLLAFYPLFSLILPHRHLPQTDHDFMHSKYGDGKNFREFKIATMRKFINKA